VIDIRHLGAAPHDTRKDFDPPRSEPTPRALTRALGFVLFSRRPGPLLFDQHWGQSGDGGDLVSQKGEVPNARSQASLDRSEGAHCSRSQDPRRARTGAQSMQTRDRP
jgi:hypothetical protein